MISVEQKLWTEEGGWETLGENRLHAPPQLVFVFGARALVEDQHVFQHVRNFYPGAFIISASTAGEILDVVVRDNSISLTAVHFEKTIVRFAETGITGVDDSLSVGRRLAEFLPVEGLVHAMVISDGLNVNGTLLVKGINDNLPPHVSVTGGLVGDGVDFKQTAVGRDGPGLSHKVVLLGFYGPALKVGYGSQGGWDAVGGEYTITKSKGNVVYELDGKSALSLYKEHLGDKASGLPGTGLLFPLQLHPGKGDDTEVVRTLLACNEAEGSVTFAGDMPEGAKVKFMQADIGKLIRGASIAGNISMDHIGQAQPQLALLVSCVGRKLVLKERVGEEVKAVRALIGDKTPLAGFYSYGELCPSKTSENRCLLHNQTMTITVLREE